MGNQEANDPGSSGGDRPNQKITTKAARKMLGMVGRNYSNEDIGQIIEILYKMAEDSYVAYRNGSDEED